MRYPSQSISLISNQSEAANQRWFVFVRRLNTFLSCAARWQAAVKGYMQAPSKLVPCDTKPSSELDVCAAPCAGLGSSELGPSLWAEKATRGALDSSMNRSTAHCQPRANKKSIRKKAMATDIAGRPAETLHKSMLARTQKPNRADQTFNLIDLILNMFEAILQGPNQDLISVNAARKVLICKCVCCGKIDFKKGCPSNLPKSQKEMFVSINSVDIFSSC